LAQNAARRMTTNNTLRTMNAMVGLFSDGGSLHARPALGRRERPAAMTTRDS
jgi:hypothetical protein